MKLKIAFYNEKISWNKDWVFLGSSFMKLQSVEKKIIGPRIKINKFLHEIFNNEFQNYLEWTEKQRVFCNDSVYWWMTELSGRNNLSSDFFLYICQIKSLIKILSRIKEKELLIVSDDILLIQAIIKNLEGTEIKKSKWLALKISNNLLNHYYQFLRNWTISILDAIICFVSARITLKKRKFPKGNIYLIHQFAEIDSLRNNKNLKSIYFPYLKDYFLKEKIDFFYLTWSNIFWSGKIKALKKLREDKCFIPEDWINIYDYFVSIRNFLKVKSCFNIKSSYPGLDLKYLILREKRIYLERLTSSLRFWIYLPAIKKWAQNCDSLTCIDHYENMIFEHALIAATRQLNIKTKIYGYHHTLSSKEFTAWHSLETEWSSKFKPDFVISLGPISSKFLRDQGVPNNKIVEGPALRYNDILIKEQNITKKNENNILIPLSQIKDSSYEVISNIKILSKELQDTSYNFIIKPHPNIEISKILELTALEKLPKNIIISYDHIDKLLNNCLFVITMSTGGAYNAVINGNIVFNLKSELNFADNYLDFFEKEFKFVNSNSIISIKNILIELAENNKKIKEYFIEFERLRKYLISGMNVISDVNLAKFKLN